MVTIYIDKSASMEELGKNDSSNIIVKSITDELLLNKIEFKIIEFEKIDFKLDESSVVVSDGWFDIDENFIPKGVGIGVGIDANMSNLKKITNKVFREDDIIKLIDYLLYIEYKESDEDEW